MRRQGLDLVEPQRWDVDRVTRCQLRHEGLLQRLRHQRKALGIGPVQVGHDRGRCWRWGVVRRPQVEQGAHCGGSRVKRRCPATTQAMLCESSKCAGVVARLPTHSRGATSGGNSGQGGLASSSPGRGGGYERTLRGQRGRIREVAVAPELLEQGGIGPLVMQEVEAVQPRLAAKGASVQVWPTGRRRASPGQSPRGTAGRPPAPRGPAPPAASAPPARASARARSRPAPRAQNCSRETPSSVFISRIVRRRRSPGSLAGLSGTPAHAAGRDGRGHPLGVALSARQLADPAAEGDHAFGRALQRPVAASPASSPARSNRARPSVLGRRGRGPAPVQLLDGSRQRRSCGQSATRRGWWAACSSSGILACTRFRSVSGVVTAPAVLAAAFSWPVVWNSWPGQGGEQGQGGTHRATIAEPPGVRQNGKPT